MLDAMIVAARIQGDALAVDGAEQGAPRMTPISHGDAANVVMADRPHAAGNCSSQAA